MKVKQYSKGVTIFASALILTLSTVQSAYAQPGTLATAPLYLSNLVQPNMFISYDDSGSMVWDVLYENGTAGLAASEGMPHIKIGSNLEEVGFLVRQWSMDTAGKDYIPPANGLRPEWDKGWPIFNHNANHLYYNPNVTYTPWSGVNADGSAMYTDADPTRVEKRPWQPGYQTLDITRHYTWSGQIDGTTYTTNQHWYPTYFTWTDSNGNGEIDQTDAHTRVEIQPGTAQMQNFANWLQYWRSRMHAAKAVIGNIINAGDATRMGMNFFNDGAIFNATSMTDEAQKRALLNLMYIQAPGGGTPTRLTVRKTGEFFRQTNGPILPASQGGECQQNFSVVMTDGFWKGSNPGFGNYDIDGSGPYDGNASQSNDGGNYADPWSDTMADAAMRYYENDLRTDLANRVPVLEGIDEAPHQHLVTYAIAFGIQGTIDSTQVDPTDPGFAWPKPVPRTATAVDDVWHAAYNSRGKYLIGKDPAALIQSLEDAVQDIAQRTAVGSAVSINSAKLTTDSTLFVSEFNSNGWQGGLFAFKIADLVTGTLEVIPEWDSGEVLDGRNLDNLPRTILTYNGSSGVPFQWGNLTTAQRADLKTNPSGGTDADVVGQARLDFLRGDRSHEGSGYGFRDRLTRLGDMVNSGPVYVAGPNLRWPDSAPFPSGIGERYTDFKSGAASNRDAIVYVGGNDGMVHGFRETDGEEVIAYVPNTVYSTESGKGLHYLTDPKYKHAFYNDLTPTISDVFVNLGGGDQWHTILVGGQRGGARGIYALDVTDPSQFSEDNAADLVLWEFTNADDPDLNFTFSQPQIAMANNGRWVAIFGNGYDDNNATDGDAKLFILDIEAGLDGSWDAGDYIKIDTGRGTADNPNGLSSPTLADLDGNGTVDRVYAGDLRGNMFAFDLSSTNAGSWDYVRLFNGSSERPITAAPAISLHPTISSDGTNAPNVMVYFGTGQYLTNADKSDTGVEYFHGVWDRGLTDLDPNDLVEQTFDGSFGGRVLTNNSVNYAGGDDGWYFELPDSGERSVTRPVVRGDLVFFNTFVPVDEPCSAGGYGYRFAVRLDTGGSPDDVSMDTNVDGLLTDADKTSDGSGNDATLAAVRQEGFLPEPVFVEDIAYTADKPTKVAKLKNIPTGRFAWMEVVQ